MLFLGLVMGGFVAGVLAGLFGIGGGILFTPILFVVFTSAGVENPETWTIATSLFCTFIASTSSSIQQRTEANFHWKNGLIVGLFGSVGVYAGKLLVTSPYFTKDVFVSVFSLLLLVVAVLFYRRSKSKLELKVTRRSFAWPKAGATGSLGGFVAALAGVGGGIVLVPLMNLFFRLRLTKAVSISSLAIVFISLSGWVQFAFLSGETSGITWATIGYVDFGTALPLITGAFAGGFAGVKLGTRVGRDVLQIAFSILIVLIALMMISSTL